MSKPRYKWWGFAKAIIRAYPAHCDDLKALREQSITPAYSAAGHGSEVHRTSEDTALCELPPIEMKEYAAVEKTIQTTLRTYRDGEERMRLIDMVFFSKTHTLQGAALACNISYGTAKSWHNRFIEQTARNFGLL